MSVTYGEIHRKVEEDQWEPDAFGVMATTTLEIQLPSGDIIITGLKSPGLWEVRDPDEAHLSEVFEDQKEILLAMLAELGAKPPISVHKVGL